MNTQYEIRNNIDYHFGLDLIVRTPATLAHRLALGDPFLHEVVNKGKVLYRTPSRSYASPQPKALLTRPISSIANLFLASGKVKRQRG